MFTNRVVWITGASSGIGEALAARFARENARVVLSARRQPELERVRQHCIDAGAAPENMLVLPLDVTDLPSLPVAADHVISHFGQIDLLINNAGLSQRSLCRGYRAVGVPEATGCGCDGADCADQGRAPPYAGAPIRTPGGDRQRGR